MSTSPNGREGQDKVWGGTGHGERQSVDGEAEERMAEENTGNQIIGETKWEDSLVEKGKRRTWKEIGKGK